jgi:hypothetical protein
MCAAGCGTEAYGAPTTLSCTVTGRGATTSFDVVADESTDAVTYIFPNKNGTFHVTGDFSSSSLGFSMGDVTALISRTTLAIQRVYQDNKDMKVLDSGTCELRAF